VGLKVFISADIEGVAGVVSLLQTLQGQPEYELGRRLMTLEVNAAIEGALECGATDIVVCDAHANMQNLLPELLHPAAILVRGAIRESLQMQDIDDTFDAVFVTGAHAAAGTQDAVLDHTWVSASVWNIRIDGRTLNETCLNDLVAGHHGVPTVLVTGDETTIRQTRAVLPSIEGVIVKRSNSRYSAASVHPTVAADKIRAGARSALARLDGFQATRVPTALAMEIDFYRTDMADAAALVPGVERVSPRTIRYEASPDLVFRMQELLLYRLRYEL
jgi:D-amino peptidase